MFILFHFKKHNLVCLSRTHCIDQVPLIGTPPHSMVGFSIAAEAFNGAGRVLFAKKLLKKEFEIPGIKVSFFGIFSIQF